MVPHIPWETRISFYARDIWINRLPRLKWLQVKEFFSSSHAYIYAIWHGISSVLVFKAVPLLTESLYSFSYAVWVSSMVYTLLQKFRAFIFHERITFLPKHKFICVYWKNFISVTLRTWNFWKFNTIFNKTQYVCIRKKLYFYNDLHLKLKKKINNINWE